jgi:hypothetical protein
MVYIQTEARLGLVIFLLSLPSQSLACARTRPESQVSVFVLLCTGKACILSTCLSRAASPLLRLYRSLFRSRALSYLSVLCFPLAQRILIGAAAGRDNAVTALQVQANIVEC